MTGIINKTDADFPENAKFKFYLCINKKYIHEKFKHLRKLIIFFNLIMQNFLRMRSLKHLRKSCTSDECLYFFVFFIRNLETGCLCSSPNALGKIPGNVCSTAPWAAVSKSSVVHLFLEEAKESSVRRLALFWQERVDSWHHFTGNLYMERKDLWKRLGHV